MVNAGSITVAVRVRPPTAWEVARLPEPYYDTGIRTDGALSTPGHSTFMTSCLREVVKIIDDRILLFDPEEKDRVKSFAERGFLPPGTKRYKDKRFMFDRVFDYESRQADVYEATSKPLLDGLLDGFNATVFAYGATGCGKTYTISGTDTDPGIIYLTMSDLFEKIEERRSDFNIDIYVTFLEIYNEEIRDLLAEPGTPTPRGGLQIREDKAVKVVGLVELHPTSADQIKDIVLLGNSRRTQSPTHANETSSRSHAVLQVHVSTSPRTASTTEQRTLATLSIIDLAGSERAAATSNMGQRMVEGANINKSLLALGNCINALCASGGSTRHIPYRNSKLTRLLKFSLGGNCKTVMIVCVAPTSNHFDDTHNTLLYADRASKIKTKVVTRNVVNVDRHVGQYVEAINRLNLEVAELKAKLAGKISAEAEIARRRKEQARAEIKRTKEDIQRKADQSKSAIVDGACCETNLVIARSKIQAYSFALTNSKARTPAGTRSTDLVAEQTLLESLVSSEDAHLQPDSNIQTQLMKSQNASNMFEAMLRAVGERRSDKLDESDIENIRLDAQCQKANMDRLKAEAQRDALQTALSSQTGLVARLVGGLTRCTVMLEDGSTILGSTAKGESDELAETTRNVSDSLRRLAEFNKSILASLSGLSIEQLPREGSSLLTFDEPAADKGMSGVVSSQTQASGSRRVSSVNLGVPESRNHRAYRSPRKSLRASLASRNLYTRRSSIRPSEKKKGVHWKDEVGQGSIIDGGLRDGKEPSPMMVDARPGSRASERDWEDEKTDESSSSLNITVAEPDMPSARTGPRRPSRLGPSFLKVRSVSSSLGCLTEDDESKTNEATNHTVPFTDRSINLQAPPESSDASKTSAEEKTPHMREDNYPQTTGILNVPELRSTQILGRRRSNVGPLRSEKKRRRSSLLSPSESTTRDHEEENAPQSTRSGPRRVPVVRTPAKRPKRLSLHGSRTALSVRTPTVFTAGSRYSDPNGSGELAGKAVKPSWR